MHCTREVFLLNTYRLTSPWRIGLSANSSPTTTSPDYTMTNINRLAFSYFAQASQDPLPFPNNRDVGVELRALYGVALELLCATRGTRDKIIEERQHRANKIQGGDIEHNRDPKLHFTAEECRGEIVMHQLYYITQSQMVVEELEGLQDYVNQHPALITQTQRQFISRHGLRVNETLLSVSLVIDQLKRAFGGCFGEAFAPVEG